MRDTGEWLEALNLGKYASVFEQNEIDLDALPEITDADLKELGLPVGPRRKILRAARELGGGVLVSDSASTESFSASLETYTPHHIAEKVRASRDAITGERKQVTVLFADIKGSTELVRDLDPEDADQAMTPAVQAMMDAVHRFEGTVNRVQGDGIMAMFGAPIAHEDHALRACYASLEMQRAIAKLGMKRDLEVEPEVRVRVGLHSGEVLVRSIGNDLSMNYDAVGLTAHLAARMEQTASVGNILMTGDTLRLVEGFVAVEPLGPQTLKGLDEPVEAYRLDGVTGVRSRLEAAQVQGLTPFIGRDRELALLEECFDAAANGRGQVVFVSGDPGMGKSRLLLELRRRLESSASWSEGRALSYGRDMAFHPLIDWLRRCMRIGDDDPERVIIDKATAAVGAVDTEASADLPYLRYLLGVDPGDPSVLELDSRLRRSAVFDALRRLILSGAEHRPQVVVFEDLHWIDSATEEFLRYLADSIPNASVLVLLTHRPGYTPTLGERSYYRRVPLASLDAGASAAMVRATLAVGGLPGLLERRIAEHADGNPFFVEEVVRSFVDDGVIRRDGDAYVLERALDEVVVPETIQGVLAARIDRLDAEVKETLQTASVIGREFARRLMMRLSGAASRTETSLHTLQAVELIYEKSLFPELSYVFKHALTQDVAYRSLLRAQRAELHALIGAAIEEGYAERIADHYEVLALHFERAGVTHKAVDYLGKAASKAVAAFAVSEALELYRRALDLIDSTKDESFAEQRVAFLKARASLQFSIGNYPGARADWERLLAGCREAGDRFNEAGALAGAAWATQWDEDFDQAMVYAEDAVRVAGESDNQSALAGGLVVSGFIPAVTSRLDEARPIVEQAMHVSRAAGDVVQEVIARFCFGLLNSWQGEYEAAVDVTSEALRIARDRKLLPLLIRSLWANGVALIGNGEYDRAQALLIEGYDLADRVGDEALAPRLLNTLGWLYLECEDLDRGIDINVRADERAGQRQHATSVEMGTFAKLNWGDGLLRKGDIAQAGEVYEAAHGIVSNPKTHPWMKWRYSTHLFASLAQYWLARGEPDKARDFVGRNMEIASSSTSRKYIAIGHRIYAEIALGRLDLEEAEAQVRQALALAERIRNPTQLWKTYSLLGDTLERIGRLDDAREARTAAGRVIRGMLSSLVDPHLRHSVEHSQVAERLLSMAPER
jgi:class 3 adenylate cyclase/tetratricopeptide (TPR) repeat protein